MQSLRRVARRTSCACVVAAVGVVVAGVVTAGRPALSQPVTRVSVASGGAQSTGEAWFLALSADGRVVAFESDASDLVDGDTNGASDVFVHDRQTGATTRVSVASNGAQGTRDSAEPSLSADGRFIAFSSHAPDLVNTDTNGVSDIFVRDRRTATTTRVSVATDGTEANGHSFAPSISADGRYVSFWSAASNLVAGDTNGNWDVFLRDRTAGTTTRVSVATGGAQGEGDPMAWSPSPLSADGLVVTFTSEAADLVAGDTNQVSDVFVHDRTTWVTTRVSVAVGGAQGTDGSGCPSISADGRYIAFSSAAPNLVPGDTNDTPDAFVHDRLTGTLARISERSDGRPAAGPSMFAVISAEGRHAAFASMAADLVPADTNDTFDVFVLDRLSGVTARVSVGPDGVEASGLSFFPALSADGQVIAYSSEAANLVVDDTNGKGDVFVRELRGHEVSVHTNPLALLLTTALRSAGASTPSIGGVRWSTALDTRLTAVLRVRPCPGPIGSLEAARAPSVPRRPRSRVRARARMRVTCASRLGPRARLPWTLIPRPRT
jgi:Tol biopolymer transport system component